MADLTIHELQNEATAPAANDYMVLDGATAGTRKIDANKVSYKDELNNRLVTVSLGDKTVAQVNALTGMKNGDSYIVTDSGTLTDGSLAVVAGDQVAWDATNGVWYKLPQYALNEEMTQKAKKKESYDPLLISVEDGYRYDSGLDKVATANFAIKKYDIDGYDKIKVLARAGTSAYSVFRDAGGNPISSFAGPNNNYEYNVIQEMSVPQGAITLELSVSTLFTTHVFVGSIGQSTEKLSASCNNVAEPLNLGTVVGYYASSTMSYNSNAAHNIDVYNVEGFDSLYAEARIGDVAYMHFVDKNKNILASYGGNTKPGINFKQILSVPEGSVYFVMSHSNSFPHFVCKSETLLYRLHIAEKLNITPLSGKKIGILGDSIAAGSITTGPLDKFIEVCAIDLNASVHNVAVGGAAYADTTSSQVVSQVANLAGDEDLIVIFASTNDFGHSSPIGEIYTTDADTGHRTPTNGDTAFCPAINKTIQALYTKFGGYVPIVLCTPIQRVTAGGSSSGGSWDRNSLDLYMEDYVKALKEEADFWGIPIFDAYKLNMNPNVETANTAYFADGLHPNDAGHAIIGHSLARFLSSQWFDV